MDGHMDIMIQNVCAIIILLVTYCLCWSHFRLAKEGRFRNAKVGYKVKFGLAFWECPPLMGEASPITKHETNVIINSNIHKAQSIGERGVFLYSLKTTGMPHCGIVIYIKKYFRAKEEVWKHKYFTMQKYNLQKNPLQNIHVYKVPFNFIRKFLQMLNLKPQMLNPKPAISPGQKW